MPSFLTILTFFKGLNLKTVAIVAAVFLGGYLIYDYVDTKKSILENKIAKKNQEIKKMKAEHTNELIILSEEIREQEEQKNDLVSHNKLLQKNLKRRKSHVNTKAKDFKSRRITRIIR